MEIQAHSGLWSQTPCQLQEQAPAIVHFDQAAAVLEYCVRNRIGIAIAGAMPEGPGHAQTDPSANVHMLIWQCEVARLSCSHDDKAVTKGANAAKLQDVEGHGTSVSARHLFAHRQDHSDRFRQVAMTFACAHVRLGCRLTRANAMEQTFGGQLG